MRKTLLISLVLALAVALTATAVTVAGDRGDRDSRTTLTAKKKHARHAGARMHRLGSLADRLDVTPRQLRAALRGIDRADARAKFRSGDLAGLKADLAAHLADELDRTEQQVLGAVRAELVAKLAKGVAFGMLTERGRDLALGCFDAPADCDLDAVKAEARFFGHHRR
jgi:hypothetical protein